MLVFDQLKKNDPQLRLLAIFIFTGLFVLFAGLWWVQIVATRRHQANQETQSSRTVRVPAVRGKILDRNGQVLAENQPSYNVVLYLEDLSSQFRAAYARSRPTQVVTNPLPFWKPRFGASSSKTQYVRLNPAQTKALERQARYSVASNVVLQISQRLQEPLMLDPTNFHRHYDTRLALPYPVLEKLNPTQIARFLEQFNGVAAADLEIQSSRTYPLLKTASHVLGYLRRDDSSVEGEEAFFSYRLPDHRGVVGIEGFFDQELRGRAGAKSVLVNNLGYRQTDSLWSPVEPGQTVVLTLDVRIQQAAERALARRVVPPTYGGAAVVMDVHTGDVLALASVPVSDPNYFIQRFPTAQEYERWTNATLGIQKNRATQEHYQPGSTFKTIVALAALEAGLSPNEVYHVEHDPQNPQKGAIFVGRQKFHDTAPPGDYDLRRAIVRSSNSYFIGIGLRPGVIEKVVELSQRMHLGERIGLPLRQEAAGNFPKLALIRTWPAGNTANICIGQGKMDVTPMQMAVMTAALANGGTVLQPRLVDRLQSQNPADLGGPVVFPSREVRGQLGVSERNLRIVREAMLDETEDREGTGTRVQVERLRICGKTGTAERQEQGVTRNTTWFISYAPFERARYAVVVMVENGASGGSTCAPIAAEIYTAIQKMESTGQPKPIARSN